jgi:Amt family ammonium transporter
MQPANIPFVMLGTALLWFGWFGFNAGSAVAASPLAVQAFLTTNTATASAMLTWVFVDHIRGSKSTAMGACVGAVVGLVGITPAAGFVTVGGALLIGMIAAVISNIAAHIFNEKAKIDDTLDVWPCHGLGGTSGMILTSLFSTTAVNPAPAGIDGEPRTAPCCMGGPGCACPAVSAFGSPPPTTSPPLNPAGAFYGNPMLLGHHLAVLVCVVPFIMIMSYICYQITNLIYPLRVSSKSEKLGLDMTQHNESIVLSSDDEVKADMEAASTGVELSARA